MSKYQLRRPKVNKGNWELPKKVDGIFRDLSYQYIDNHYEYTTEVEHLVNTQFEWNRVFKDSPSSTIVKNGGEHGDPHRCVLYALCREKRLCEVS